MKPGLFLFSLLLLLFPALNAQQVSVKTLTQLSSTINETSGLLFYNGKLITHNDSGGEPVLYELDSITGTASRQVRISNASNIDWEDICMDEDSIYIADFGNNQGTRTNLRIFKIAKSDFENSTTVQADTLTFFYADQSDFTSNQNTNFDAEALISIGDSLYVFTKNWGNQQTNVYALPKNAKNYGCTRKTTLLVDGWITAADYNPINKQVFLVGYTYTSYFSIKLQQFLGVDFASGLLSKRTFTNFGASHQVEGISWKNEQQLYLTSEKHNLLGDAWLGRITWIDDDDLPTSITEISVSPNPATDLLFIHSQQPLHTFIYGLDGRLMLSSASTPVPIAHLQRGMYVVQFRDAFGTLMDVKKIWVD